MSLVIEPRGYGVLDARLRGHDSSGGRIQISNSRSRSREAFAPELCRIPPPSPRRGRAERRASASPRPRVRKNKQHTGNSPRTARRFRRSARGVSGLLRTTPGGLTFQAPSLHCRVRRLPTAAGCDLNGRNKTTAPAAAALTPVTRGCCAPGPYGLGLRMAGVRRCALMRPPPPIPRVVTFAMRPSVGMGWWTIVLTSPVVKEYFQDRQRSFRATTRPDRPARHRNCGHRHTGGKWGDFPNRC